MGSRMDTMVGTHYVRIEHGKKIFTLSIFDKDISFKSLKEAFARALMSFFYTNIKHAILNNFKLMFRITLLHSKENRKMRAREVSHTRFVQGQYDKIPLWEILLGKEEDCPREVQEIFEQMIESEKRRISNITTPSQTEVEEEEIEIIEQAGAGAAPNRQQGWVWGIGNIDAWVNE